MFTGRLKEGDKLIWRHINPEAFASVEVERVISVGEVNDPIVRITDGRTWHIQMPEDFFRPFCMRDETLLMDCAFGRPGFLRRMWDLQEQTADQTQ